ncbi:hypothetical protein PV371_02840 [Streptomyces sp. TX20-6-3]|uniref:hypothetical protein n=1 Tax=Streptomyces sp. TX20-6-3 TaxID=3028705 RepID=UPI0029BE34D1|nr:hypothetical protein [Streptomyces sp. TX20-6-3]MDX2558591.1 hypothetical protein [Streptomyces sp. TX20-6-3]
MTIDNTFAGRRLARALDGLTVTFRGMTARQDEVQCDCHWGSAEELALLKVPGAALDSDLLRRTWTAPDWADHGAVLRRILPRFAAELVDGRTPPVFGMDELGHSFARGHWRQWPTPQAEAVREFLHAWWAHALTDPNPTYPVHELLALCAEASDALGPWLAVWEALDDPVADRHLAEAAGHWDYDLLGDELPWRAREEEKEEAFRLELGAWLVRHAPARLGPQGAHEDLLHRIRLIGLTGPARWEDPHWPDYRY